MPSPRRLSSVCHNIAHHAVSGLSFIHPHVMTACRGAGWQRMEVNLLEQDPCPEALRDNQPLRLSLQALKGTLERILGSEGFSIDDVRGLTLVFTPDANQDDYCTFCEATLVTVTGKVFTHIVDYAGQTPRARRRQDARKIRLEALHRLLKASRPP